MEFEKWPKVNRLKRELTVTATEKIDGTNSQVHISDDGLTLMAGSRNRYVTPEDDNYGFAKWCEENKEGLLTLGPGRHYGEWYGAGIQRRYGLDHKRFALFNSSRWTVERPTCCYVVPVVYHGVFKGYDHLVAEFEEMKNSVGSMAVPGWDKPEGLFLYFHDSRHSMKMPLDK